MTPQTAPASKYVYAVIDTAEPCNFTTPGIGGRGDPVHTITAGRLSAVVSDSPQAEYDNTRRNMMAHTLVLEEVMRRFVMLPVRFGTVAPDPDLITQRLLGEHRDELAYQIEQMRGRIELGLKASWQDEVIFAEILEENPAIRRRRDSLAGQSPERTHFERVKLGEQIAQAMYQKRVADEQRILDRLRPFVHKTRLNKPIGDRMVINAAFLVDNAAEADIDAAIRQMDAELGNRFQFKYVGPVPPYNFVDIPITWN